MPGMMKQETLMRGSQAKGGVCPKSSKSKVERESHSLKCTNSGVPLEKSQFFNQKISLNLPGETSFNFYVGIWEQQDSFIILP
jgi:hypothetical protein